MCVHNQQTPAHLVNGHRQGDGRQQTQEHLADDGNTRLGHPRLAGRPRERDRQVQQTEGERRQTRDGARDLGLAEERRDHERHRDDGEAVEEEQDEEDGDTGDAEQTGGARDDDGEDDDDQQQRQVGDAPRQPTTTVSSH